MPKQGIPLRAGSGKMYTPTNQTFNVQFPLIERCENWKGESRYFDSVYEVGKVYINGLGIKILCVSSGVTYNEKFDLFPVHYYEFRYINANNKPGKRGYNLCGYWYNMRDSRF